MIVAAPAVAIAVILIDVPSVAVLLPTIRLDLGSSSSGAAWVMAAYLLALAAVLPVVAKLGRGRAFAVAGGLAMAAGAVVCATAGSTAVLVAGRAVQGAGAAAVLGSLAATAREPTRFAVALPAVALAIGPLVGGVFAELNWWHVYFWMGVPMAAIAALPAVVAQGRHAGPTAPIVREVALAAGLTAVAIALLQSEDWRTGWWVLLLFAGAVLLRAARLRGPSRPAAIAAFACGCIAALLFLMPEYYELVRRLSGLRGGVLALALTVPAAASWAFARALGSTLPQPALTIAGALCVAVGLGLLVGLDPGTAYAVSLAALVLVGSGLGLAVGMAGDGRDPAHVVGWAAAGALLGLAFAAKGFQHVQADERSSGASFEAALSSGIGGAATVLLILLAAVALLLWLDRRGRSAARPAGAS
jgi:MFS family permease